jgi:hypothetical protein
MVHFVQRKINMKKTLLVSALMVAMSAGQAYALTITFGGQNMNTATGDQSGLSSSVGVNDQNVALPGFFVETFDSPASSATLVNVPKFGGGTYPVTVPAGAGFNTLDPTQDILVYSGGFGIQKGSTSNAATPAGDQTFFVYAPGKNQGTNAEIGVDYTNFLKTYGVRMSYLGIYYGSIDTYNNLAFYSGNNLISGSGLLADGILTGSEILAAQGGSSGNQFAAGSNVYVNLSFDANDPAFTSFRFNTTGIAFEADNIVGGFTPVPEPATILLFGAGLIGLASVRRKKTA